MKKTKLCLLALLPTLLLVSCGDGAEVKDEQKIDEIKANISKKTKDIKNYELTIKQESSSYDDELKKNVSVKADMVYRANENQEAYFKSTGTRDGEKGESTIYLVRNEQYKQILYVASYNVDEKKDDIAVYGYDGNETTFAFAAFYFIVPTTYLSAFADPTALNFDNLVASSDGASKIDYDSDVKYYSKGDDNLTIKAEMNAKGEVDKNKEEYGVKATYTIHYDKGYFKSAVIEGVSNKDNKSKIEMNLTVKDEMKIELPSGWEELINKNSIDGLA